MFNCYSMIEVIQEDPPEYYVYGAQSVPVVRGHNGTKNKSEINDWKTKTLNVNKFLNDPFYFNSCIDKFLFSNISYLDYNNSNDLNLFSETIIDYLTSNFPDLNIVIHYEKYSSNNNQINVKVISKSFFKIDGITPYYNIEKPSKIVYQPFQVNLSNNLASSLTSLFVRHRLEKEVKTNTNNFKYLLTDSTGNKFYMGIMANSAYLFNNHIAYFLIDDLFFNSQEIKNIIHFDMNKPETILFNSDELDVIKMIHF